MPGHRRRHLPQRIGENIGQHQVERLALRAAGAPRSRCPRPPPPDCRRRSAARCRRRPSPTARSMSLASTLPCSALAAAIASTPVPVPRSSTRRGLVGLQDVAEQQQAAAGGAVMAGAEGERRLDLDAELVGGDLGPVMLAMDDKAPGMNRHQLVERRLDPVLGLHRVELDGACGLVTGGERDQVADRDLFGASAKCMVTSQRPLGPSKAATAASPSRGLRSEIGDTARGKFVADRKAGAVGRGVKGVIGILRDDQAANRPSKSVLAIILILLGEHVLVTRARSMRRNSAAPCHPAAPAAIGRHRPPTFKL